MAIDLPSAAELTGCLCLRLRKVTRKVTQIYDKALEPSGLTSTQFSLLASLHVKADISIGDLAARLVMDSTTLTRVLRPLERKGHVAIATDRDDRRRRTITLTESGQAAFREAAPLWRQAQSQLGDLLGRQDREAFSTVLDLSLCRLAGL